MKENSIRRLECNSPDRSKVHIPSDVDGPSVMNIATLVNGNSSTCECNSPGRHFKSSQVCMPSLSDVDGPSVNTTTLVEDNCSTRECYSPGRPFTSSRVPTPSDVDGQSANTSALVKENSTTFECNSPGRSFKSSQGDVPSSSDIDGPSVNVSLNSITENEYVSSSNTVSAVLNELDCSSETNFNRLLKIQCANYVLNKENNVMLRQLCSTRNVKLFTIPDYGVQLVTFKN